MIRQFTILLASVLLVFALTACGGDDKNTNQDSGDQNTAGDNLQDAGDNIQDAGEDILDAGKDVLDPDDNGMTDGNTNENQPDDNSTTDGNTTVEDSVTKQNSRSGATYGQMLRNARVHDTDGFLKDMENSVTPGAA